ncbi:MAG: spore coat polysaccharide biosynthesis protein SpsF [Kiritimatiellia bacterium]|jgi:spore coat polysaccharide biosynthesis protein SpsF
MKNAVFIPVRLASERLPQKALIELSGKPVLEHLIARMLQASSIDQVTVCTTTLPDDDPLEALCARSGAGIFRGSNEDLLQRYCDAARAFEVTHIVNCDGDDVLLDAEQVDKTCAFLHDTGCDYVRMEGLPLGANPLALTTHALNQVCAKKSKSDTATGWGIYFEQSDQFKVQLLQETDPALCHPDIRMTLDYPEDLAFFAAVYAGLYQGEPMRMREIIAFVHQHPEIKALNAGLDEIYAAHFNSGQERIQDDV